MAQKEIEMIQPTYFRQFSCIGPACTDNCCHDWYISIDKKHYLQYKAVQDPKFQALCSKVLVRNKDVKDPKNFAHMRLTRGKRCVFQDEDGGCGIYRLLGPDALSDTCTVYPRLKNQFMPGVWELSLTFSCQEAARLALFSGEKIRFERFTHVIDPNNRMDTEIGFNKRISWKENLDPAPYQSLRESCLELMGLDGISIPERILAIGLLLRRAGRIEQKNHAELSQMSEEHIRQVREGALSGVFEKMEYSRNTHLWALVLPANHLILAMRKEVLFQIWEVLRPLCTDQGNGKYEVGTEALEFILQQAEKGDRVLQENLLAAENYFTNYIFSSIFPFTYGNKGLSPEYHGVLLAEQYSMLRILLGILPEAEGETGEQRLLRAVVTLARITQHTDISKQAHDIGKARGLDTLAFCSYLLR